MVELSVVIPTMIERDRDVPAIQCLEACQYHDYEVIIRRDDGASQARNEGIRRASADKIVFLDDDSMPRDGYLLEASRALSDHPAVSGRVVQPEDAPFKDKEIPWYDQGDVPKRTELLAGCNMAMRRELLDEIGYFNEKLPYGHEETELAARICREHYIHYNPEMVVVHYFAESIFEYWQKSYRHGKMEVRLWQIQDKPWHERLLLSVPVKIPRGEGEIELIARMAERIGRVNGLLTG